MQSDPNSNSGTLAPATPSHQPLTPENDPTATFVYCEECRADPEAADWWAPRGYVVESPDYPLDALYQFCRHVWGDIKEHTTIVVVPRFTGSAAGPSVDGPDEHWAPPDCLERLSDYMLFEVLGPYDTLWLGDWPLSLAHYRGLRRPVPLQ